MIEEQSSLSEKFIKKWIWLYVFSYIIAPMGYVVKIIVSQELSVSEVWILYWIISLISLVTAYNDLWMSESINHFVPQYIQQKQYNKVKTIIVYAFLAQMITWVSIALFFFFWAEFLATHYFKSSDAKEIMQIFALYFLWINIFEVIATFFMAVQNTFYNKIMDFWRMGVLVLSTILLYLTWKGTIITYSYSWIIGLFVGVCIAIFLFYKNYFHLYLRQEKIIWSKEMFIPIFTYALLVFLWAQAWTLLGQIDMQMIIYMLGTKDAWYYTNYLSIISIPFMIIWPIFALLFPVFSELHSKKEYEKINTIKTLFNKNFLSIWIAFNILFFVFAEKIALILFGEKYIMSWIILKYSILLLTFNYLLQVNFNIMAGIGKVKERIQIILIAVWINIISNYIFIKTIWVAWASLATGIGWFVIWILSEIYLGENFKSKFDLKFLGKNIFFLSLLWGGIYFFINPLLISFWRIKSLLFITIISIIYFCIFWIFNYKEFINFIKELKGIKNLKTKLWNKE
jgi:O-antigen/teichoic acid export membrane protein